MKVELTLDEKPGPLHLLAGVDIIVLIMLLGFVVTGMGHRAGVPVRLAESAFRVAADVEAAVLTVKGGLEPVLYVDGKRVEEEELAEVLGELRDRDGKRMILVRADARIPAALQIGLGELILGEGLECVWLGEPIEE